MDPGGGPWARRPFSIGLPGALLLGIVAWRAQAIRDGGFAYSWDLLGYVGCAVALDETDAAVVHARTYAAVREQVSPAVWRDLTGSLAYRSRTAADPRLFVEQLPFYRGRYLYTLPVWLLSKLGVPLVKAVVDLSVAAWALTVALLFVGLARRLPGWAAATVALGLGLSGPLMATARSPTPDGLMALLVVAAAFVYVELQRPAAAVLILGAAMLARPDAVLCAGSLAVALAVAGPATRRWPYVAAAVGLGLAYALHSAWVGARSWWVVLQFTALSTRPDVDQIPRAFDWGGYLHVLDLGFARIWGSSISLHVALAVAGVWASVKRIGWPPTPAAVLLAVFAQTEVVRFLLFPRDWDRLLAPLHLGIEVVLVVLLAQLASEPPKR